jgi:RimJ/RimL family protein N-acetyltransferase
MQYGVLKPRSIFQYNLRMDSFAMKTTVIPNYEKIEELLSKLNDEVNFFSITIDRVKKSKWIIPEYINGKLVGIVGIEKKLEIMRSWTIVKKECWEKGIGAKLVNMRKERCLEDKSCNILLGIVERNNIASIKNIAKQGYVLCGRRGNLLYYFQPITQLGKAMTFIIKIIFPITKIIDRFRK